MLLPGEESNCPEPFFRRGERSCAQPLAASGAARRQDSSSGRNASGIRDDAVQELLKESKLRHCAQQKWFPKEAIRRSWFARSLQAIDHEQIRQDAARAVGVRLSVRAELEAWDGLAAGRIGGGKFFSGAREG